MMSNGKIAQMLDEKDALWAQNPVAAILYLSVLAFAVTMFLR
jgi:hypothetical protein